MYRGERVPEIGNPESETIPDQALTVRDIITRFTRGQINIPPIETGDADDIDDAVRYDDIVDASEDFARGANYLQTLEEIKNGQENKDTTEQAPQTPDLSVE